MIVSVSYFNCTNQSKEVSIVSSSADPEVMDIPLDTIDINVIDYNNKTSLWSSETQPFSGYVTSRYSDLSLKSIFGLLNGKKQNTALEFFPDGHLKSSTDYNNGRIHGEKKSWSLATPHVLLSSLNYSSGKPHGEQKQWYPTGEIFKVMNLDMGKEAGMQPAYRKKRRFVCQL